MRKARERLERMQCQGNTDHLWLVQTSQFVAIWPDDRIIELGSDHVIGKRESGAKR